MILPSEAEVEQALPFKSLIPALRRAFSGDITVPMRHHHDFAHPSAEQDSTLLLMPAWKIGETLGVKVVTVSPENAQLQLPAIHGVYLLFDASTGQPLLQCDARTLTSKRTAAASALAADYLARPDSEQLLMVGTGVLAPQLIAAHATVRSIKEVYLWGRNPEKAQQLKRRIEHLGFSKVEVVVDLAAVVPNMDIISVATLSPDPLIFGKWLRPGQHIDLVGSYKPSMREADDEAIVKAQVYVDTFQGATKETGDIVIPLQKGILRQSQIKGDLFGLCRAEAQGRNNPKDITLFKSVGHALEDLAAADLLLKELKTS